MIDRLRTTARTIAGLAVPSLVLAGAFFAYAVYIVFTSTSHAEDRHLFPSILACLWALSLYGFIETFQYVPQALTDSPGWFRRVKRRLSRLWYWLIAMAFLATSAAILVLTLRTLSVWFAEYGAQSG